MKHELKIEPIGDYTDYVGYYIEWLSYSEKQDFDPKLFRKQNKHMQVLVGHYSYEDYSGHAFGLFFDRKQNKLFEVNGSHCSCYGLEGQWELEETSVAALKRRLCSNPRYLSRDDYPFGDKKFADMLDFLEKKGV